MLFQQTSLQAAKLTSTQVMHCTEILEFLANCRDNVPNGHSSFKHQILQETAATAAAQFHCLLFNH